MRKCTEGKLTLLSVASLSCPFFLIHNTSRDIWVLPTLGIRHSENFWPKKGKCRIFLCPITRQNVSRRLFSLEKVEMILEKVLSQASKGNQRRPKADVRNFPSLIGLQCRTPKLQLSIKTLLQLFLVNEETKIHKNHVTCLGSPRGQVLASEQNPDGVSCEVHEASNRRM